MKKTIFVALAALSALSVSCRTNVTTKESEFVAGVRVAVADIDTGLELTQSQIIAKLGFEPTDILARIPSRIAFDLKTSLCEMEQENMDYVATALYDGGVTFGGEEHLEDVADLDGLLSISDMNWDNEMLWNFLGQPREKCDRDDFGVGTFGTNKDLSKQNRYRDNHFAAMMAAAEELMDDEVLVLFMNGVAATQATMMGVTYGADCDIGDKTSGTRTTLHLKFAACSMTVTVGI